jgi:septum site-determining protein MinC
MRDDASRPEAVRDDASRPEAVRDDASRPEAMRDDASRPEGGRVEPGRVPADRGTPTAAEGPVADTLMVRQTLRSGQRVEFPGHVVVLGDVNSGAEIVAAGDIVVLGALRGLAHAGAPHDSGAVIVALGIQPPQLRIGTVISRDGAGQARREPREREAQPEIARVEGETIVVETFRGRL